VKGSRILLTMLREYDVEYVFGLPGETTLPLYVEWLEFKDVGHVMFRDERNACFAADGYARVSYKPGICEAPSAGAAHILPAIVEAYASSLPIIAITTDTPLHLEKRNMLTGFNQTAIFNGVTKETLTVLRAQDIPFTIRRAFRIATCGKPGPVHIRIPVNVLEEDAEVSDLYGQRGFSRYPGQRFTAEEDMVLKAVELLLSSEKPIIVCGQGVLYSQAWDEIIELAELLNIPVGTTITGKGSFPETHPLSIGVIGSRGGTSFSNEILKNADLVFYVGCNTDYAATNSWTLPPKDVKIIHLDISEAEVGNNLRMEIPLIGDAKSTLKLMMKILKTKMIKGAARSGLLEELREKRARFEEGIAPNITSKEYPPNPIRIIKTLENMLPKDYIITCDAGVSAIYTATFLKVKEAGRRILFNYSMGALGYAVPAAIGAYLAKPKSTIIALTGDGSFGFTVGEYETLARLNANVKIILFNNQSYGWIRASILFKYGPKYFETEFKNVDYVKIAEGFGLKASRIEDTREIEGKLRELLTSEGPMLLEIPTLPEDKLTPPVPSWAEEAKKMGIRFTY